MTHEVPEAPEMVTFGWPPDTLRLSAAAVWVAQAGAAAHTPRLIKTTTGTAFRRAVFIFSTRLSGKNTNGNRGFRRPAVSQGGLDLRLEQATDFLTGRLSCVL